MAKLILDKKTPTVFFSVLQKLIWKMLIFQKARRNLTSSSRSSSITTKVKWMDSSQRSELTKKSTCSYHLHLNQILCLKFKNYWRKKTTPNLLTIWFGFRRMSPACSSSIKHWINWKKLSWSWWLKMSRNNSKGKRPLNSNRVFQRWLRSMTHTSRS